MKRNRSPLPARHRHRHPRRRGRECSILVLLLLACVVNACEPSSTQEKEQQASLQESRSERPVPVTAPRQRVPAETPDYAPARTAAEVEALIHRVESEPDFACARAYQQTIAAIRNSPPTVEGRVPADLDFTEEAFLEDCHAMPIGVQRCLVVEYAFTRNAFCKGERARYDDARTVAQGDRPAPGVRSSAGD